MILLPPVLKQDEVVPSALWDTLEHGGPGAGFALSIANKALESGGLATPALGEALAAINGLSPWGYAHGMALVQWLMAYTPPGLAPLDQVRGWLEAFYHACEAELWAVAEAIAEATTEAGVPLYQQLGQWGHCREQVELCETLLPYVMGALKGELRQLAGDGQRRLGDYAAARQHYEALQDDRPAHLDEAMARQWQVKALMGLAQIDIGRRRYRSAIRALTALLPEARALAEVTITIEILQELGLASGYIGRFDHSLALLQEALALAQAHGLGELEVTTLGQMAKLYEWRGQSQRALPYIHRCLAIAQAQQNLESQAEAYMGLARANFSSRRFTEAIAHGEQSLALYRHIHQVDGELVALNDLGGMCAYGLGQMAPALDYFRQAVPLARQLGSIRCTAVILANQAYCYAVLNQTDAANSAIQSALRAASDEDLADDVRAIAYACLARVHWVNRRYLPALALVWRALWLDPPWQSLNGQMLLRKAWETILNSIWPQCQGQPEVAESPSNNR